MPFNTRSEDSAMPRRRLWIAAMGTLCLLLTLGTGDSQSEQTSAAPRLDQFGDPLPEGAIARLGTVRFRHGANIAGLSFTPDGKAVISRGFTGVRVWESSTGKELASIPADANAIFSASALSADATHLAVIRRPRGAARPELPIQLLDRATGRLIRELSDGIYIRPCFSPDGKQLAVAGLGSRVELFDLAQMQEVVVLETGQQNVNWLTYLPDGKTLVTAGRDASVHFWDLASKTKTREVKIVNGPNSLALSPNGKLLAAIEHEESPMNVIGGEKALNHIHLFDTATGQNVKQLVMTDVKTGFGDVNRFWSPCFSPDGKRLAAGAYDEFIRVYDIDSATEVVRMKLGMNTSAAVAFSPDGKTLAAVEGHHSVRLFNVATGKPLGEPGGHLYRVNDAVLSADGKLAVTAGGGERAALAWDPFTGKQVGRLETENSHTNGLFPAVDGRTLFLSTRTVPKPDGESGLHHWDLATLKPLRPVPTVPLSKTTYPPVYAQSPDGKLLVVAADDAADPVRIVSAATGEVLHALVGNSPMIHGAAFTGDGRALVVFGADAKAHVWDVATGKELRQIAYTEVPDANFPQPLPAPGQNLTYYRAALSPDDRYVVFAGRPRDLVVHDFATGKELKNLRGLSGQTSVLAFSPDGRMLARGAHEDADIRIYETATWAERLVLKGHRGGISTLRFSADGNRLISGSTDTTALVWDLSAFQ
jgi:WD40 repeat protein